MTIIFYCLLSLSAGAVIVWLINKTGQAALQNLNNELTKRVDILQIEVRDLTAANAVLVNEVKHKTEQFASQKEEIESVRRGLEKEFQLVAQRILDEKTQKFNVEQERALINLLSPLKQNIDNFKTSFESRYNKESEDRISLREQIRAITQTNQLLSEQANNLVNALKGQVKQQGNWGELILESILEFAGLNKDLHYFVQERAYDESGNALLPDVVVRYPDARTIIIDSKVSLKHYEEYCNCKDPERQQQCLDQLITSVYRHIDTLSSKNYQEPLNALDFVMLFVPVEGAYICAMQGDLSMWQYAYKKRVLLMSPTNLIAAMKLVYDIWKKDEVNRNAQQIADKAVKIYEKLAAFIEDFEKIGAQIQKASQAFEDAQKKMYTGKGNLLSQAQQMKVKLHHNKPNRELPADLVERAVSED
jgi:DNA recombination protein RmuC